MRQSKLLKQTSTFAVVVFFAIFSSQVFAAGPVNMSVIEGYASSRAVLNGDYEKAIKIATADIETKNHYRRTVEATTLCVAYTKSGMLETAGSSCVQAIEASLLATKSKSTTNRLSRTNAGKISIVEMAEQNQKALLSLVTSNLLSILASKDGAAS